MTTARTADETRSGLIVLLCCLVGVLEGYDLQVAGVAAPKLGPAFAMTQSELAWFFSASTFGLMLGALVGGRLSDRFGRKAVLVASVGLFGLMTLANGLAADTEQLLVFRFLTGVGLGGALPNLLAMVAESTGPARRNTMLGLLYAGLPFGGALASLLSIAGAADDWRLAFHVGGIAPLLLTPVLLLALPATAKLKPATAERGLRSGFASALFGAGRGGTTVSLWVAFFVALLTMYVLLNWLPSLLVERGLSRPQASLVQVAFNLAAAAGSIATGLVMDRLGRTRAALAAFGFAALGLVVLAAAPAEFGFSLMAGAGVGAAVSTTQALLYALAPAAYPTALRGTGVGAGVSVGRFGSAVGPLVVGLLLTEGASPQAVLSVLVPAIAIGGAAAVVLTLRLNKQNAEDA